MTEWPQRVIRWQKVHGRHDLPWQNTHDPYRVWLSEIMLQQTQVITVIDYFSRFLARFADVRALANANLDEVLGLWSGLGYYSRARHLHRCAQDVVMLHGAVFPRTARQLQTLPGIGPSTAAAIASLCFGERVAILDGNVKRVLTRALGFDSDLTIAANERLLWDKASALLPMQKLNQSMPRYTQGVMDLGATVCTARNPRCSLCPVNDICVARQQGDPEKYPFKTRKLRRSAQSLWLLWARTDDAYVWMSKRPSPGIWGGLYCFPLFADRQTLKASVPEQFHGDLQDHPAFTHVLTHKDLHLHVVEVQVPQGLALTFGGAWLGPESWPALGLPAPVRRLLLAT